MAAKVIIGVDPHKTTHIAVAVDDKERQLAKLEVRANASQLKRLLAWAEPFEERTWAVEGSGGCEYLLAQQLVDAGEYVLDVPATLASRASLLGSGKSNKNDPNEALSVAVAALRTPRLATVRPADRATVLEAAPHCRRPSHRHRDCRSRSRSGVRPPEAKRRRSSRVSSPNLNMRTGRDLYDREVGWKSLRFRDVSARAGRAVTPDTEQDIKCPLGREGAGWT